LLALLLSLVSVLRGEVPLSAVLVASVGLFAYSSVLSSYFKVHGFDLYKVFPHYIRIAMIASCLAIAQQLFYLIGFVPGYNLSWLFIGAQSYTTSGPLMRVYSCFTEPGYYAAAVAPAVFLAVKRLATGYSAFLGKTQAVIIVLGIVCSFAGLGYLCLFLSVILSVRFRLRSVLVFIVLFAFLVLIFRHSPSIASRVDGVLSVAEGSITGYENTSVLIIRANYVITKYCFLEHPFVGSGLGSSQYVSRSLLSHVYLEEGLERVLGYMDPKDMGFDDASTIYFKITRELGIFGWIAVLWFLLANRIKNKCAEGILLQRMCFVFFAVYSLRTGQYNRFELWYFIFLYAWIKRFYDRRIERGLQADDLTVMREYGKRDRLPIS
jgi:hypothetical protein